MNRYALALLGSTLLAPAAANATVPLYPTPGALNAAVYNFTATSTGDVIAYFAGQSARLTTTLGLMVNGVDLGLRGLNNHATVRGTAFNFGPVNAGDSLTFILAISGVSGPAGTLYSTPSLNSDGLQHIYSTAYSGGDFGIPAGVFVGWEDILGGGDKDYNDHLFVFTNVGTVPEPASWAMMIGGLAVAGMAMRRRKVAVSFS